MRKKVPVTVLASGGIDSTALLHKYLAAGERVRVFHFQYGQPNRVSELKSLRKVCKHYGLRVKVIKLDFDMFHRGYELVGRNALFVLTAASLGPPPSRIGLGIHRGLEYYDVTPQFVVDCQRILDGYYGGAVVVDAPFVRGTKSDIIRYCKRCRVPLHLTYSCQMKNSPPCGQCPSCLDRRRYLGNK